MEIFLIISILIMGAGSITFALSGRCLTNGVDMPKQAVFGISLFLLGCALIVGNVVLQLFTMLESL